MRAPIRTSLAAALAAFALGGCFDPGSMILSSVASAALRTAIDQAEKNRPTPEQMWHEAQVASLERQAIAGDVEAQFQIGTYYLLLQEPAAEQWICEAASRGHAKAQLQYGHWFNEDRHREDLFPFIAIAPDNATAYLWYSLSASNGEPRAPHFRDSLRYSGLAAASVQQADMRLAGWAPGPCGSTPPLTTAWSAMPATTVAGWHTPQR